MKTCNRYDEQDLLDYLCDRQDEESLVQMQFHLLRCRVCCEKLKMLRSLSDDLSKKHKVRSNRHTLLRLAMVAVVVLTFSIFGYYYGTLSDEKEYPVEIKQSPMYSERDSASVYRCDSLGRVKNDSIN